MSRKAKLTRDPEQIRILKSEMATIAQNDSDYGALFDLLLSHGGYAAAPRPENDLIKILDRGYLRDGRDAKLMRGRPIGCHSNSALLWTENRDNSVIVTGWAMSDDGVWRQHSWVKHLGTNQIYETTNERLLYYGFDLTTAEAELFYDENAG